MSVVIDPARTAIVAHLSAIDDIGRVHDHERYVESADDLAALYVADDGQLRGWYVQRTGTREASPSLGRYVETATWKIQGYMALADNSASELRFDALLTSMRVAFRTDETLGGAVASTVTPDAAGLQLERCGPVMFCGNLCHAATFSLTTIRYL